MFQFPYPTGIVEGLALEGWRTKVTVRDGRVGSAHHPECIGQRTAVSRAHLDRGASFTRDSRTEPPYERSTLKSPVNALTGFIQKSSDVHIHESCPCSESRSFRNLDSATRKIHFARLDANPMSSRLAPKVANEVSHGRKFNSNYRRFHAGTGPLVAVGVTLSHESYVAITHTPRTWIGAQEISIIWLRWETCWRPYPVRQEDFRAVPASRDAIESRRPGSAVCPPPGF